MIAQRSVLDPRKHNQLGQRCGCGGQRQRHDDLRVSVVRRDERVIGRAQLQQQQLFEGTIASAPEQHAAVEAGREEDRVG